MFSKFGNFNFLTNIFPFGGKDPQNSPASFWIASSAPVQMDRGERQKEPSIFSKIH